MSQTLDTTIQELDTVILTHELLAHGLHQGDLGAVVHVYPGGTSFEVEFVDTDGDTLALLTLTTKDIQVVHPD